MRLFCMGLTGVILLGVFSSSQANDIDGTDKKPASARSLVRSYDSTWREFVGKFQAADNDKRLKLVVEYEKKLEVLLADHTDSDSIRRVLPLVAKTRVLDVSRIFLSVIEKNPKRDLKALAMFHLGHYFGNNRRFDESKIAFTHLKKTYGKLRHNRETYAAAADEALYYFENLAVGRKAPATSGEDVDGTLFSLSDYEGKVVVLRFWGDWCGACRAMYPYERDITKRYRNRPFALIGVNSDSKKRCRMAQEESKLTWRSFWDGPNSDGAIAQLYQVEDWPRIIVIDSNGVIRMNARGLDRKYLTSLLDRLVDEAEESDNAA